MLDSVPSAIADGHLIPGRLLSQTVLITSDARLLGQSLSLVHVHVLPDHSVSKHLGTPVVALSRYPSAQLTFLSLRSGLRHSHAGSSMSPCRIEFVILRTGRSPPAALHHALLRRSCIRFQAGERLPGEDFHFSERARSQARVRRWLCLAVSVALIVWVMPLVRALPYLRKTFPLLTDRWRWPIQLQNRSGATEVTSESVSRIETGRRLSEDMGRAQTRGEARSKQPRFRQGKAMPHTNRQSRNATYNSFVATLLRCGSQNSFNVQMLNRHFTCLNTTHHLSQVRILCFQSITDQRSSLSWYRTVGYE